MPPPFRQKKWALRPTFRVPHEKCGPPSTTFPAGQTSRPPGWGAACDSLRHTASRSFDRLESDGRLALLAGHHLLDHFEDHLELGVVAGLEVLDLASEFHVRGEQSTKPDERAYHVDT